jgi:hypothetical protein
MFRMPFANAWILSVELWESVRFFEAFAGGWSLSRTTGPWFRRERLKNKEITL